MESDSSETNLVIITNRDRMKWMWKLYWRVVILTLTPFILLPIAFIDEINAYKCFYIFLVTAVYWVTDVLHPGVISVLPILLYTIVGSTDPGYVNHVFVSNELLDYLGIMMIIFAIERSSLHRRIALKLLLVFGCSHYRLSLILFFSTTFLAMWLSDIIACGIMMPFVKAILTELERMGILEIHQIIGKARQMSERHEEKNPRPTKFAIFYFLGVAYSSTIGSIATIMGSPSVQIFKLYSERLFPSSPHIEFPHVILLNLPGVLLMETMLYLWMNSYFLGMFRSHSDIALEIGMTEEEAQYIHTLLKTQYQQIGKIKFHEAIVGVIVILTCILHACLRTIYIESYTENHSHLTITAPCLISAFLFFVIPTKLDFLRFFQKQGQNQNFPRSAAKSCLNWNYVQNNMNWSMLFVIASSCASLVALKESGMIRELESTLKAVSSWPVPLLALVVVLLCKLLTEFAPNPCVAYCVLPSFGRLAVASSVNPHYLMMAATLGCSLPFHLITGSPVNALVASYVHIPPWKMIFDTMLSKYNINLSLWFRMKKHITRVDKIMTAGIGPSVIAVVVGWFAVAVWSRAIWTDIHRAPIWASDNTFQNQIV